MMDRKQREAKFAALILSLTEDQLRELIAVWNIVGSLTSDDQQQAVKMYQGGATVQDLNKKFKEEVPVHE